MLGTTSSSSNHRGDPHMLHTTLATVIDVGWRAAGCFVLALCVVLVVGLDGDGRK